MKNRDKLLASWGLLVENDASGRIEPGEYTAATYAQKIGKSSRAANAALLRHLHEGTVTRRMVVMGYVHVYAYRPAGKK